MFGPGYVTTVAWQDDCGGLVCDGCHAEYEDTRRHYTDEVMAYRLDEINFQNMVDNLDARLTASVIGHVMGRRGLSYNDAIKAIKGRIWAQGVEGAYEMNATCDRCYEEI